MHGLKRAELDISGLLISGMERLGLVWDVQRVGRERLAAKSITA
jgi:hypothetical protein